MFKITLDSFTTSDNQTIMKSVADIQKDIAEQKNIAEGSDDYKQLENEAREQAYKQIYNRMCTLINNTGMKVQIGWFRNSSDSQSYGRFYEVKDYIIGPTRTNPDGTTSIAPMTVDENDYNSTFYNDMLSTINSMKASNSSAYAVANLALSQVGNNYVTYCNEMNNGVAVDWCGIFVGWCLKKTGVEPADVGYSPSVPTWKRNAVSKGLYKQNNAGYQPKVGDLVIFDYNPEYGDDVDHIEIVVEAQPDCIATVGGNTGGGGYLNSRVSKTVYRLDYYGIDGFVNIPYLNTSGMCAASQSFQSTYGYLNQSGYYSVAYPLNDTQKEFVAKVVEGEYGGDPDGCLLIAQCIRDALIDGKCTDPMKIRNSVANGGLGYDGWKDTASAEAKEAVEKIFQQGMYAVRYKIRYMCTKSYYEKNPNAFQHQVPLVFTYYGKTGDVCFFSD